jgi:glutamate/tyrosine decarboxylase-like PLP-dependent enzyme
MANHRATWPAPRRPDEAPPLDGAALDAAFLGPLAENADLLETLVVDALRDHAFWRRNFHPHDPSLIPTSSRFDPGYQAFVARTEHVLRRLASDLKGSAPWFSPRYIGHMASDLLIPGVVARFIATLYNPNNVSLDAGGRMLGVEIEVGAQVARMVGYDTREAASIRAWGHLTSGGTVANFEALWRFRAVRLLPIAIARGLAAVGLTAAAEARWGHSLDARDAWTLANVGMIESLDLRRVVYDVAAERGGASLVAALHAKIEEERVEQAGLAAFLADGRLALPVVLAPHSAHYSWSKAMKLLGLGARQLISVDTDEHMRMDPAHLASTLDALAGDRRPVLGVIGVLGTTEFGTFDPIDAIVAERDRRLGEGQTFGVHVDAAWGGYLTTLFRQPDLEIAPRETLRSEYRYFPSVAVYSAFRALAHTDSITVDPHKLGFIPYPAGAFVARDRRVCSLLSQAAPYVFDERNAVTGIDDVRDEDLGRYVIEGSKPGSSAASVYAVHEVLPLHRAGFGALLARTIRASEWLYDTIRERAGEIADVATLIVPLEPDSNIVCLAINPAGNRSVAVMNEFVRAMFDRIRLVPDLPPQAIEFIGSFTSIMPGRLTAEHSRHLLERLALDDSDANLATPIFLLRHTLMNPWLLVGEPTPLAQYLEFLFASVRDLADTFGRT